MRLEGWILLTISWSAILSLGAFCFWKIFSKKEVK
jgi:hypothetical protein